MTVQDSTASKDSQEVINVAKEESHDKNGNIGKFSWSDLKQKKVVSLTELLLSDIPDPEWLIEPILPKEGIALLAGHPGSFKSFFAQYLSVLAAKRNLRELFDTIEVQPMTVLVLDEENRAQRLKGRFKKIVTGQGGSSPLDVYLAIDRHLKLNMNIFEKEKPEHELLKIIEEVHPDLVIFDSLVRFFDGNENEVEDVRKIFEVLRRIVSEYHTSFLILHHNRKGSPRRGKAASSAAEVRGSGDLVAMVDALVSISKLSPDTYLLRLEKSRDNADLKDITFQVIDGPDEGIILKRTDTKEYLTTPLVAEEASESIAQWLQGEMLTEFKTKEVNAQFAKKHSKSALTSALALLKKGKKIEPIHQGSWRVIK